MNRFALLALTLMMTAALPACAPDKPWMGEKSTVEEAPMRLVESRHMVKQPLAAMDEKQITEAARVYRKNGAGPLYLVVAFNDKGKTGDSVIASEKARIEGQLRAEGIASSDIIASTVPLETEAPVALIAFDTLEAKGPAECENVKIPGYHENAELETAYDYKTGCGVKNMMAMQIATPTDLEGVAGLGGRNDGEHLANVVTTQIRPGTPREFLPSYVLSALAGSGN